MQIISGILIVKSGFFRSGTARINFHDVPRQGEDVRGKPGNVSASTASQIIVQDDDGVGFVATSDSPFQAKFFKGFPAYAVHFREFHLEDRTSAATGGGEMDEWVLNSDVTAQELDVEWRVHDEGRAVEIGFICCGVPAS